MIFLPFIIEVILLKNRYDFCYKNMEHFSEKTLKTDFISTQIRGEKNRRGGVWAGEAWLEETFYPKKYLKGYTCWTLSPPLFKT